MNCCRSHLYHEKLDTRNKSPEGFLEGWLQAAPAKGCHLLQQGFNQLGKVVPLPAFVSSCYSAEQIGKV